MHQPAAALRGYTLIELLMTVTLAAVLLALAAPSFARLFGNVGAASARDQLAATLNTARLAAVSRGDNVVVCPSDDQNTCNHALTWHGGWIVFVDRDRNGEHDGGESLLSVTPAMPNGTAVTGTEGRLRIRFRPDGTAVGSNATLTICARASGPSGARSVVINQAGRIRLGPAGADRAAACLAAAG